jgi:hypothetical protein
VFVLLLPPGVMSGGNCLAEDDGPMVLPAKIQEAPLPGMKEIRGAEHTLEQGFSVEMLKLR